MSNELNALSKVCRRLETAGLSYFLTGSLALSFYCEPRFTNDIDLVIALPENRVAAFLDTFSAGYYLPAEIVAQEARSGGLFNLIDEATGIKIDCIMLHAGDEFAHSAMQRRVQTPIAGGAVWVISREDLILAKLRWAKDSHSETQLRDVRRLLEGTVDAAYLSHWIVRLGLNEIRAEAGPGTTRGR